MEFGLYLRSFLSDRTRALHEQLDDAVEICHTARDVGFATITMPQHWASSPTLWPQPFPTLARLAPETGDMKLMTGILLLPLHNPLQVAEDAATLDHISKGRFVLGVGIGYREAELEAVGATRKDRVPRLEESLQIMKALWSGEEVNFEGHYWRFHGGRMGFTPIQKPHPPVWIACQSEGAVRRAARIADACYLAPQIGFNDLPPLIEAYKDEHAKKGSGGMKVSLSRGVSVASSRTEAIEQAREAAASSYRTYSTWNMQESSMVQIHISSDSEISDWAVAGSPDDCLERFANLQDKTGIEFVNATFLNLPKDLSARREYLQRFSETIIRPLQRRQATARE